MEQPIQIGTFIRDMRTERGMTQQQLADRLGITDKAVSKWERNICYPDITLLRPLSDALGVTVTELLAGCCEASVPTAEDAVVCAIRYTEDVCRKKSLDWRLLSFMGLTAACIIAAATCMICDLAVNGQYLWSPPVYPSLVLGWLLCTPLLLAKSRPVRWTLVMLTVSVLPYLRLLGWLLKVPMVTKLSLWIVPMVLAYLWLSYWFCLRHQERKWQAAGWVFLLAVPLLMGIHLVLNFYIGSDDGHPEAWMVMLVSAACFTVDYVRSM